MKEIKKMVSRLTEEANSDLGSMKGAQPIIVEGQWIRLESYYAAGSNRFCFRPTLAMSVENSIAGLSGLASVYAKAADAFLCNNIIDCCQEFDFLSFDAWGATRSEDAIRDRVSVFIERAEPELHRMYEVLVQNTCRIGGCIGSYDRLKALLDLSIVNLSTVEATYNLDAKQETKTMSLDELVDWVRV